MASAVGDHAETGTSIALVRSGLPLQRPADVTFAPDGRLFFADDLGGQVYWVAPDTLTRPD